MSFVPVLPDQLDLRYVMNARDVTMLQNSRSYKENGHLQLIKATDCVEPPATSAFLQDKVIKAVLLTLKHSSASQRGNQQGTSIAGLQYGANKKSRYAAPASYDRMATFADLLDPPNVFATFTHSRDETMRIFGRTRSMCAVGTPFYIYEPGKMTGQIHGNVSIIPLTRPLIPLHLGIPEQTIADFLPSHPLSTPTDSNTHFFIMHTAHVDLSVFRLLLNESCTGLLCDRAFPGQSRTIQCGCVDTATTTKSAVAQFSVMIHDIPPSALTSGEDRIEIDGFRSFRTTQLFFEHIDDYARQREEAIEERAGECRISIEDLVRYVNEPAHGGWTIVGWSKIGVVEDASNPGEKVDSAQAVYHISLLVQHWPLFVIIKMTILRNFVFRR